MFYSNPYEMWWLQYLIATFVIILRNPILQYILSASSLGERGTEAAPPNTLGSTPHHSTALLVQAHFC